jgi:hypothetical protein
MLDETLLLTDTECRICGTEVASNSTGSSLFLTDGTAEQNSFCAEHVGSYLQVCFECCAVYTANPGGVCRFCLGNGNN